jgi:alanyl-tRNA synthetase
MKHSDIRQQFITYYQGQGYSLIPRSPMLHPSAPMSFAISCAPPQPSAIQKPASSIRHPASRIPHPASRIQNPESSIPHPASNSFIRIQPCFRHFDLDAVGRDRHHLSLFEMAGAFDFGKNTREKAVSRVWQLATRVMGMDPKGIWISYFSGGRLKNQPLPKDRPTYLAWRNAGVSDDRLVGLGTEHNYWMESLENKDANDILKCGPNTEMFYDSGRNACSPDCKPGCSCGKFIEFSNVRFVLYEFHPQPRVLKPLDTPLIETVIGTERIAMILQGADSVFDTASYQPIIRMISSCCQSAPRQRDKCEQIIADHLRALCALVSDGAPGPGRSGRARIIRVIIRKILTCQMLLGIALNDLLSLIPLTGIRARETNTKIRGYAESESLRFQKTVERGRAELERMLSKNQGKSLSGRQIVSLEKKWGLPNLLIETILHEKGLAFTDAEYKEILTDWKDVNAG